MASIRSLLFEGVRVSAIMAVGDVICQKVVEKRELRDVDLKRVLKFSSVGLLYIGPALKFWYGSLDKIVPKNGSTFKRGLKKMALDQICFAPVFLAGVISVFGLVNGDEPAVIKERLRKDYKTVLTGNYMLWPPAQIINFTFIPINYQVVFAQFVALFWNIYLSLKLNDDNK
ncbi:mpv17-like protein [Anastrepha obliqua]|uniref:mpv17-like protein n=1 Tax=Anastrepha obliqua TaxID=95512 RepID=UPI00240A49F7|nr:mpv17-like protein [Anastrepha obliqua]